MTTSGTTTFALSGADLVLEAFERLQVRASEITADHMVSARRSMNLVQVRWANRGTNLWKVDPAQSPLAIPLIQGVPAYNLPTGTVMLLDCYLRVYQMASPVSLAPAFATTGGSPVVTVTQAAHGLGVGNLANIIVPVAIGGIVLQGFYPAVAVLNANQFTIAAAANAISTASGGAVPAFTTTSGSAVVSVALAGHGLSAGESFGVQVATVVGGITLSGTYAVTSVTDSGHFTIAAAQPAGASATASENGGLTQIADQTIGVPANDRLLTPISRSDYAATPNKLEQAPPTVYYFDRQSAQPTVTLWQVPDSNGPYQLIAYTVRQLQDANALASQSPDIPYRFNEALCAELALHLARKYPPRPESGITLADLTLAAQQAWEEAAQEDRERVSMYLVPDFSSYFR